MLLFVCEDSVALLWEDAVALLLWPARDAADPDSEDDDELVPFFKRAHATSQAPGSRHSVVKTRTVTRKIRTMICKKLTVKGNSI